VTPEKFERKMAKKRKSAHSPDFYFHVRTQNVLGKQILVKICSRFGPFFAMIPFQPKNDWQPKGATLRKRDRFHLSRGMNSTGTSQMREYRPEMRIKFAALYMVKFLPYIAPNFNF